MRIKRIAAAALCTAIAVLLLAGCGGTSQKNYPVSDLAQQVVDAVAAENLSPADAAYVKGFMKLDTDQFDEWAVYLNTFGTSADEFGIFKAGGKMDVKTLKTVAEDYLALRREMWSDDYFPEEKPKMTNAEVRVIGNYVMYCILGDSDRQAAFNTFNSCLSLK